jgi:type I restriction enzyme R subunit
MNLIAQYTQSTPKKQTLTREALIGVLSSTANLMDDREDMIDYINTLEVGKGLNVREIRDGYQQFKTKKITRALTALAQKNDLPVSSLQQFTAGILSRMIFDGEKLNELFAPLDLGWKERTKRELALMEDLIPLLRKQAEGREIAGLNAYE